MNEFIDIFPFIKKEKEQAASMTDNGSKVTKRHKNGTGVPQLIMFKKEVHRIAFGDTFYEDELFPIRRYQFGSFKVSGPHKIKKYLDRKFNNWKKIRIDWPHHVSFKKALMCIYNRIGLFP